MAHSSAGLGLWRGKILILKCRITYSSVQYGLELDTVGDFYFQDEPFFSARLRFHIYFELGTTLIVVPAGSLYLGESLGRLETGVA